MSGYPGPHVPPRGERRSARWRSVKVANRGGSALRTQALGFAVAASLAGAIAAASAPGSPIRAGGVERTDTWSVVFLVLLASAFALYVAALVILRACGGNVALVCAVAVVIQLVPLGGPLLLSRDTYSYWAYGRIVASHDRSPFTTAPARFPHDPATRVVAPGWRRQVSVYGPAFTLASAALSDAARRSAEVASLLFRTAAAIAGIGAAAVAAVIASRPAYAAAFVGWNPLVAISFAGGGHNDAWMLALIVAALALVAWRRDVAGGVVWALAAAIKAPALAILVLQLLRSRRGVWIGAALGGVGVGVVATVMFGPPWMTVALQLAQRQSRYGLAARLAQLGMPAGGARVVSIALLAGGAVWLGRQALRGRSRLALGACLLVVTSPWVLPWYATWPVVLAAVDEDGGAQLVALALAVYLLPDRIPL